MAESRHSIFRQFAASDWRGFLGLDPDVTVTLAVRAAPDARVSTKQQLAALRAFAERIVQANSDRILVARGS